MDVEKSFIFRSEKREMIIATIVKVKYGSAYTNFIVQFYEIRAGKIIIEEKTFIRICFKKQIRPA